MRLNEVKIFQVSTKTCIFWNLGSVVICAANEIMFQLRSFFVNSSGFLCTTWELLRDELFVTSPSDSSWTFISSSDSLGCGLIGGDWLVDVDDATLLLCANEAAYDLAKPSWADAARSAAVEGLSALNAECSPPISKGIDPLTIDDWMDAVADDTFGGVALFVWWFWGAVWWWGLCCCGDIWFCVGTFGGEPGMKPVWFEVELVLVCRCPGDEPRFSKFMRWCRLHLALLLENQTCVNL